MNVESNRKKRRPTFIVLPLGCLLAVLVPILPFVLIGLVVSLIRFEERLTEIKTTALNEQMVDLQKIDHIIEVHSRRDKQRYTTTEGKVVTSWIWRLVPFRKDIDGDSVEDTNDGSRIHLSKTGAVYRFRSSGPTSAGFNDIEADGFTDAWCCDPADCCFRIIWGIGIGEFGKQQMIGPIPYLSKGVPFDVDKDGDLDIVVKTDERVVSGEIVSVTPEYSWIKLERRD